MSNETIILNNFLSLNIEKSSSFEEYVYQKLPYFEELIINQLENDILQLNQSKDLLTLYKISLQLNCFNLVKYIVTNHFDIHPGMIKIGIQVSASNNNMEILQFFFNDIHQSKDI